MRTLLVCSPGGHFRQLAALRPRMGLGSVVWAVSDNPQRDEIVGDDHWIPLRDTPSRDWSGAARMLAEAERALTSERFARVVSTGALPAVPFFSRARIRGIPCYYIESAARSDGPSMTGRMVSKIPGVKLFTQYPNWASRRWQYRGSVFDSFAADRPRPTEIRRAVVTLGVESFGFRRAVERLVEVLPPDVEVLWQTGSTDTTGLPIEAHPFVPAGRLREAIGQADLVVAHSGVGSILTTLDKGKSPFLLPREQSFAEHIDDHQFQIARELGGRGLAQWSTVADLTWDALCAGSQLRVKPVEAPDFPLG